jgi:hypothetical protein
MFTKYEAIFIAILALTLFCATGQAQSRSEQENWAYWGDKLKKSATPKRPKPKTARPHKRTELPRPPWLVEDLKPHSPSFSPDIETVSMFWLWGEQDRIKAIKWGLTAMSIATVLWLFSLFYTGSTKALITLNGRARTEIISEKHPAGESPPATHPKPRLTFPNISWGRKYKLYRLRDYIGILLEHTYDLRSGRCDLAAALSREKNSVVFNPKGITFDYGPDTLGKIVTELQIHTPVEVQIGLAEGLASTARFTFPDLKAWQPPRISLADYSMLRKAEEKVVKDFRHVYLNQALDPDYYLIQTAIFQTDKTVKVEIRINPSRHFESDEERHDFISDSLLSLNQSLEQDLFNILVACDMKETFHGWVRLTGKTVELNFRLAEL